MKKRTNKQEMEQFSFSFLFFLSIALRQVKATCAIDKDHQQECRSAHSFFFPFIETE